MGLLQQLHHGLFHQVVRHAVAAIEPQQFDVVPGRILRLRATDLRIANPDYLEGDEAGA